MVVKKEKEDYNIFRDSLIRYLGYANEIGESFRYQFPNLVRPSYVLAFGYCGMDALSSGYKEWNRRSDGSESKHAAIATFDTLLWQSLASVMIPGATINVLVRVSRIAMARTAANTSIKTWFPTCVGLGSIPIIVHPIDAGVDYLLDNTTRRWTQDR